MLEQIYLGIDMDDRYAVVSLFESGMNEPQTISMISGSEIFRIPVRLTKIKGEEQWYIGEEAKRLVSVRQTIDVDNLLGRAVRHEKVYVDDDIYSADELFLIFFKKLLSFGLSTRSNGRIAKLAVALPSLTREATEFFSDLAVRLELRREQLMLIDRKESFYYYAYSQTESLCLHDLFLFDYRDDNLSCCILERNRHTRPQVITLSEEIHSLTGDDLDEAFLGILEKSFRGRIISSVYLTGDGFDGDWMKRSVSFMCRGRRAFMGKNLYSKGACHAAMVKSDLIPWQYVYMGENVMKENVFLKVINHGTLDFYTLVSAGENWYETEGKCDVILDGESEINFWIQPPHSREARIENIKLADLPDRPNRTTRLSIAAKPVSDKKVRITIRDLGFGDMYKSSGKVFEYNMEL